MKALLITSTALFVAACLSVPLFADNKNVFILMLLTILVSAVLALTTIACIAVLLRRQKRGQNVRSLLIGYTVPGLAQITAFAYGALQRNGFALAH